MATYNIPLFPLNSVLFPSVPVFLHIFEERYKEMINHCLDSREPFGIVLIEEGVAEFGPAEPYKVGCSADIVRVERLDDGRMNIVAVGKERFRILETNDEKSYLQGRVESFPIEVNADRLTMREMSNQLRPIIENYIDVLKSVREVNINWSGLPDDPLELGYLGAYLLQIPAEEKQAILTASEALEMLRTLRKAYHTEIGILRTMHEDSSTVFSLN